MILNPSPQPTTADHGVLEVEKIHTPCMTSSRFTRSGVGRVALVCLALSLCLVTASGCGGERQDPLLRLSAQEALDTGKAFLERGKYFKARRHLIHAFEVEPNSRLGREALLLAADALYLQGSNENLIKCEAKYRDFLNRFPTSDQADYAQFKVGSCLAGRAEKPDRDQKTTRLAIDAHNELLRLYPNSQYAPEARQKLRELTDQLAAHELVVATFYNNYGGSGICTAAVARLEELKTEYPQFSRMDEALFQMVVGYGKCLRLEEAGAALQDLERRFPDSTLLTEARKIFESDNQKADKIVADVLADQSKS